jgi:hypothetical protein
MEYLQLLSAKFHFSKASSTRTLLSRSIKKSNFAFRLKEVIYSQEQLYLVFEYLEFDLKKYMRAQG